MPEGDKYDGVPRGYGKAFRYLRNNAEPDICDRQLLLSTKGDPEGAGILTILKLVRPHLERALLQRHTLLEASSKRDFDDALERLKVQHGNSAHVLRAVEISKASYLDQHDLANVVPDLSQALGEHLVLRLLDPKRQTLMVDLGQNSEAHTEWRRALLARLRPHLRKLFGPCFEREGAQPRLSRRKKPPTTSTSEQLQQEVPVL